MPRKRGRTPDPGASAWTREIAAATEAFSFLATHFGAAPATVSAGQRECALTWALPRAAVRVFFEAFAPPCVGVRILSDDAPPRVLADLPLLLLVRDAAPGEEEALHAAEAAAGAPPDALLERLAGLVQRTAGDLLRGDRTRLPRLRQALATERRRRDKERFGTSTGETPRFDRRPTLAELFSDVTNEGLRSPRAYQAFWDWDYPLSEIAAFLGCDERAVQALLDSWDGL